MRLTRAVTPIRLCDANHAKIAALDALAADYLRLCQAYTTYFCTEAQPDTYAAPCFNSPLSQRWQRVAVQHAAGIAQSWRSNYAVAYQDYLDMLAEYQEEPEGDSPEWKEWNTPILKEPVIQANANVALREPAEDSTFDYWLRVSTLEQGHPIFLPVKLADYHRQALAGKTLNTSTVLTRKPDGWWLMLSYDEDIPLTTPKKAPVIGIDVGIANFITTSDGKQYGTFNGKLAARHQRDREKRRRKAKLRACLKKKGTQQLPSTRNKKLARQVRQEINRAVNQLYADHPSAQFAYEQLNVAGMRFKARRMNAYLYGSNLAHIPKQLAWGAAKRSIRARTVKSAYSSQECHRCHHVARENRPNQQTFCCVVCGHTNHADVNAAENLASRLGDQELAACADRRAMKALLEKRHQEWQDKHRLAVVQPPAQLVRQRA
ncbi:MAG: RNA-guided endonuclease InsQ/TnpB family protein [Ktedonobacterales bacterium]